MAHHAPKRYVQWFDIREIVHDLDLHQVGVGFDIVHHLTVLQRHGDRVNTVQRQGELGSPRMVGVKNDIEGERTRTAPRVVRRQRQTISR